MSSYTSHSSPTSLELFPVEYDFASHRTLGLINDMPLTPPADEPEDDHRPRTVRQFARIDWAQNEKWKDLPEPFLHIPAEIHLLIFALLNPIDAVVFHIPPVQRDFS